VDCIPQDPKRPESGDQLMERYRALTGQA
jgi:hypothetical protein